MGGEVALLAARDGDGESLERREIRWFTAESDQHV